MNGKGLHDLSSVAPQMADALVLLSSDIALVLDADGIIQNVSQRNSEPISPFAGGWVGSAWADVVGSDARAKVERLLEETLATGRSRRREINQPGALGTTIPVEFTAMRLGAGGPVLAVGRDLRAVAAIQQRFMEAQQDIEKSYWRARQADSQYRLLFEVATDAVMVVEAETLRIVEANEAAVKLFGVPFEKMIGRPAHFAFDRQFHDALTELLTVARSNGQPAELSARIIGRITTTSVAATPFRTDRGMRLLVRVRPVHTPGSSAELSSALGRLVRGTSDGVVVTDSRGHILLSNPAFHELLAIDSESAIKGRNLTECLEGPPGALEALLSEVRREGIAHPKGLHLRATTGAAFSVDINASLLTEGDQECLGFTIHPVAKDPGQVAELSASLNQLVARLGAAPLAVLVQEATDLAQAFLVAQALDRCGGNVKQAAEMLGVSAESLVVQEGRG